MNTTFTHSKELNGPVLVTGAGGCIGSWVAALLVKENIPVVAFDLSQDTRRLKLLIDDSEIEKIKWITSDITDTEDVNNAIKDNNIQSIIHLAALQVPFCAADPINGAKVNVVGTVNIFEAVRQYNIKHLVYASSVAAHGLISKDMYMPTLYGAYKLCDENIAHVYHQDWGVPSIGFRPGIAYGVGRDQGMTSKTTFAILAAASNQSYTIPFSGPISALHVREVASALITAASKNHDASPIFDMNGICTTVEDWVNILKKIEPKTKIIIEGKAMQFPFEASDEPLREYIGNYEQVNLENGIQETFDSFKSLLSKGMISSDL